jgi:Kef-type K+ transport system membrane component KefB
MTMASVHHVETVLVATLLQLIVIILVARLAGNAAVAVRQPRVVGEMVAGLVLGPSFFGLLFPQASLAVFNPVAMPTVQVLSQIGLILLMFQIGSDFQFDHLRAPRNRRATVLVAIASIAVPLGIGGGLGYVTAPILAPGIDPLLYILFLSVAFSITAVPVMGRILREYALTRTDIGVISISAAAVNDVAGWTLLAPIAALATAQFPLSGSALHVLGLVALTATLWVLGRPMVDRLLRAMPLVDGQITPQLMAVVLAMIFAAGILTEKLGVFTIFGGFLIGFLFHRRRDFVDAWQRQLGQFVLVFFLPIFFTYTGLGTNVAALASPSVWAWFAVIFVAATLAKVVPVYAASRLSGFNPDESVAVALLMNTRGLMELVVLNIGFQLGFIPQDVFTMLVLMAVGTTMMTGPLLHWALHRDGQRAVVRIEA